MTTYIDPTIETTDGEKHGYDKAILQANGWVSAYLELESHTAHDLFPPQQVKRIRTPVRPRRTPGETTGGEL